MALALASKWRRRFLLVPVLAASALAASAQEARFQGRRVAPGELLIALTAEAGEAQRAALLQGRGFEILERFRLQRAPDSSVNRLLRVAVPPGHDLESAIELLNDDPLVEYVHPNYIHHKVGEPNDTYFGLQWGLQNTGDNTAYTTYGLLGPDPREPGADMRAVQAFDLITAAGMTPQPVIIGVIDSGVDVTHPDLEGALWDNSGEIPGNGADDDNNGYADDIHGWDFAYDDDDPMDGDGHGTHVAGVVGATRDNGQGVSGVAPNARLMALQFLDDSGSGSTADAIDAITYAIDNGALVINASWGGGGYEPALVAAITAARDLGILFVAAGGNDGMDTDAEPHYPSSYTVDNVISVAASSAWMGLAEFSNFGLVSVHIAAPGDEIISTTPDIDSTGVPEPLYQIAAASGYPALASWGGTSMAAPAVSGAAAILYGLGESLWPGQWTAMTPVERMFAVRDRLLTRSRRWASLDGGCSTGGHLDLLALIEVDETPPADVGPSLVARRVDRNSVTVRWVASGDDGRSGRANYYDLRIQEGPGFDFQTATPVTGVWTPSEPGLEERHVLGNLLAAAEYTVGLEVVDDAGNRSPLSTLTMTTDVGPAPLFDEDFESGLSGEWIGDWLVTDETAHSGVWCITDSPQGAYPENATLEVISPEIGTGPGPVILEFWQTYELETGFDFGYLDVRTYEAGAWGSWQTLKTVTGANPLWHAASVMIPDPGEMLQIRFRVESDYDLNYDGWHVDDVVLGPSGAGAPLVVLEDTFDSAGNWHLVGDWGLEAGTLSDSPAGDYAFNNFASAVLATPLDLSGAAFVAVDFELVSFDYETDYDFLAFDYSLDGQTWRRLGRFTGTTSGLETFDLSFLAGMPGVWLRFQSITDHGISLAGAQIDNFTVSIGLAADLCPADPSKADYGVCGCGVADVDTDGDDFEDCIDLCPSDPDKIEPGICGCGIPDGGGVCGPLFADGFESGDACLWSSATGGC